MTKDEARTLVISQTFVEADTGRRLHHCFMGTIGADWDEEAVLAAIDKATDIDWEDSFLFGKGLAVYANNKHYFFDSVRPPT